MVKSTPRRTSTVAQHKAGRDGFAKQQRGGDRGEHRHEQLHDGGAPRGERRQRRIPERVADARRERAGRRREQQPVERDVPRGGRRPPRTTAPTTVARTKFPAVVASGSRLPRARRASRRPSRRRRSPSARCPIGSGAVAPGSVSMSRPAIASAMPSPVDPRRTFAAHQARADHRDLHGAEEHQRADGPRRCGRRPA